MVRSKLKLVGVLVLWGLVTPAPADAAFPGKNGRIAFTSLRDSSYQIYSMNPDGSGQTRLTVDPANPTIGSAWSPRGDQIASRCETAGDSYLCVMNGDGSGSHVVLYQDIAGADLTAPAWAPSGSRLVFAWERESCDDTGDCVLQHDLGQVNADGTGVTTFNRPFREFTMESNPAWDPDGSKIAYDESGGALRTVRPDWTGDAAIVASGEDPNWSPDGSKIVFSRYAPYPNGEIFVVDADGTNETRLTNNAVNDFAPAWSPDGMKIVFGSSEDGDSEIFVMNADGSGRTQLTHNTSADFGPDWQPIPNRQPDCSGVTADPKVLWPPTGTLRVVELGGATDPDGDAVTIEITGVTQDERVRGVRDAFGAAENAVRLRARRDARGDGRVYRIALTAADGKGGECEGTATVSVPRHKNRPAVDSAPPSYDSFGR